MRQGFQKYSDMRQDFFSNSTCDMAINNNRDMRHWHFLKSTGDMGTPPSRAPKERGGIGFGECYLWREFDRDVIRPFKN